MHIDIRDAGNVRETVEKLVIAARSQKLPSGSFWLEHVVNRLYRTNDPVRMSVFLEMFWENKDERMIKEPALLQEITKLVQLKIIEVTWVEGRRAYVLASDFRELVTDWEIDDEDDKELLNATTFSCSHSIMGVPVSSETFRKVYEAARVLLIVQDNAIGHFDIVGGEIKIKIGSVEMDHAAMMKFTQEVEQFHIFDNLE